MPEVSAKLPLWASGKVGNFAACDPRAAESNPDASASEGRSSHPTEGCVADDPLDPLERPAPLSPEKTPPGKPLRQPIEGVYELGARVMNGKRDGLPSKGWLAITNRYLFLTVAARRRDPDLPPVHSSLTVRAAS